MARWGAVGYRQGRIFLGGRVGHRSGRVGRLHHSGGPRNIRLRHPRLLQDRRWGVRRQGAANTQAQSDIQQYKNDLANKEFKVIVILLYFY